MARELAEDIRNRDIEKKYYILINGRVREKEFKIKSWLKKVEEKVIEVDEFFHFQEFPQVKYNFFHIQLL